MSHRDTITWKIKNLFLYFWSFRREIYKTYWQKYNEIIRGAKNEPYLSTDEKSFGHWMAWSTNSIWKTQRKGFQLTINRNRSRPEKEPKDWIDQMKSLIRQDYWWHSSGYRWRSCTSYCTTLVRIFSRRGRCRIDCCVRSKCSLWWSHRWTFCFGPGTVLFGQTEALCSPVKFPKSAGAAGVAATTTAGMAAGGVVAGLAIGNFADNSSSRQQLFVKHMKQNNENVIHIYFDKIYIGLKKLPASGSILKILIRNCWNMKYA